MTPHSAMAKVEHRPGVLCNKEYLFETPLKVKARENSLVHNIGFNNLIVLKFFSAVFCAKLQSDWATETNVMDERDFTKFEFKMRFGWISYIAQHTWYELAFNIQ